MFDNRQVVAILPAAGSSARMGLSHSKLLCEVEGDPVLLRTLKVLDASGLFDLIIIACRDQDLEGFSSIAAQSSTKTNFVRGGQTRQESVRLALTYLETNQICSDSSLIAVHDAARCHVSVDLLKRCVQAAAESGAVTAAIDSVDTVYQADSQGVLDKTLLQRSALKIIQTPQVFKFGLLWKAHNMADIEASDDAGLVAQIAPVSCVAGEASNRKITSPEDL